MYNPSTHLDISRARHSDLLREARQRELARSVSEDRPGLLERLRSRFGATGAKQPVARAAG
jgi:hypothetical protein